MKQPSLRTKIFASFGLIIFLVMGVSTFAHIQELKRDYLEALEWRSEALAQLVFRDIMLIKKYTPTTMKNYPRLSEKLSWSCKQLFELNQKSSIIHCAVINSQGFIVAHNRSAQIDQQVSSDLRSHIQKNNTVTVLDGDRYHTLIPIIEHINEEDIFFGMIDIGVPQKIVSLKIKRLLIDSIGLLALFLLVTFFCISSILYVVVGKPLSRLMHVANEIMGGNYRTRAQLTTHDEIGQTGRAFDTMTSMLVDTIEERDKHIESINQLTLELEEHRDHLEELVKERTEELEVANKAKSRFLANMSHELRTPLNVIMGYSQLMQKDAFVSTEQQAHLATINRNGEHLLAMINDVLAISKIEAGQLTIESTTFDLPALFRDLEKTFVSGMDAKGLFFEVIGVDDLPRYVTADEVKLRQVLVNLLGNAVKFTDKGGITLRVAAKDETADAMRLAVEVQDTGIGIAEDELDKVFVYLEQTGSGRTKKIGTGLGLAISRDYVRMMGGDITVTSKVGKGSAFRFEIDIKKGDEADIMVRGTRQRVIGLLPGQKAPRVLVVEDQRDSRTLLVKVHKKVGIEVEEAVNGKEAVEMFNKWRPDFIWMDIRMPVMDGREAARRIKKTDAGQSTVVVALTAHALEEEREQILDAGFDDFVSKPFRQQQIFEVMAKHLGVQYVYEDALPVDETSVDTPVQMPLIAESLSKVPDAMLTELLHAAEETNPAMAQAIIDRISEQNQALASELAKLAADFRFDVLRNLIEADR